ncbi:putative hexokinase-like 2 protein isoform X2 [Primulina tabacum]|uniref:putative hexokinase-like 2 protein isoform X2 n=1 Tax=Primulina tabacum TaxID=48773 RepID=UPI003F59907E
MKKEVVVAAAVTTAAAVVGAALLARHWKHRSERRLRHAQRILRKFATDCATPVAKLWHIANELASEMQRALAVDITDGDSRPPLPLFVSYQAPLPSGDEKGTYYGIYLRGTNFVMLRAKLDGKNEPVSELQRQEVQIPSSVMADANSSKELLDFISLELAKFVSIHAKEGEARSREHKLGFTVSFPADQAAAFTSTINFESKDLSVDATVGRELRDQINKSLEKNGLNMQVFALVDDTIGNLAGGRYYSKESVAAVTLGMATDVSYIESPQQASKLLAQQPNSSETVVNMQWGNYTSSHLPLTEFDVSLDVESTNPGHRIFEKLISGMYLGEIVRRVLLKMARETALFGDCVPPKLAIPYLLKSPDMAAMHQDTSEDYEVVTEKLKEVFEINDSSPMAREIVAEVCDIVVERGARLVGAGIVGIVKKQGRLANKRSVITMEGGLYEHYRIFGNYLHSSVWEMLGSELSDNVIIEHSHGGSGAGSIFLAAAQTQYTAQH